MFHCKVRRNKNGLIKLFCTFLIGFFTCCLCFLTLIERKSVDNLQCLESHKCHRYSTCHATSNSYICKCSNGFYGDGINCQDINECKQELFECPKNEECLNMIGSYICQCRKGFHRTNESSKCTDNNECLQKPSPCNKHALCINTHGGYNCTCKFGYTGNGKFCQYNPDGCTIPEDPKFPNCNQKLKWLTRFWGNHPCYKEFGVDGTVCSFIRYLSEVETECPLLDGRTPYDKEILDKKIIMADLERTDSSVLLSDILHDKVNHDWIKKRISSKWNDWVVSFRSLKSKQNLQNRKLKNILVFIGTLVDKKWDWASRAKHGGPLGELVQWADLISAIYILGHNLKVSTDAKDFRSSSGHDVPIKSSPCGARHFAPLEFDIVYIDIHGLHLLQDQGFDISKIKCKFRIIDSFGTEARFNFLEEIDESEVSLNGSTRLARQLQKDLYGYGNWKVNLKQIMTMFPHSPDNSFLGFIVGHKADTSERMENKENIALVYGKQNYMFQDKTPYLAIIQKYLTLHGTASEDVIDSNIKRPFHQKDLHNVPKFVQNHGVMAWNDYQSLLKKAKIFVGLGFPFEGPAPLEAIARGVVFLNPKWQPPVSRLHDREFNKKKFFEGKPTLRKFASQHSYMESFVGKPYVYTLDIKNKTEIRRTVQEILRTFDNEQIRPYLPYEFTNEGMLERLNAYIENQDFCNTDVSWPSEKFLRVVSSRSHESCKDACTRKGLLCENSMFKFLNQEDAFEENDIVCYSYRTLKSLLAPYRNIVNNLCTLQKEPLLYSCVDAAKNYERLCPCREYLREQVALWPGFRVRTK